MNWRAYAAGILTLVVIETATRDGAAGRVGGVLGTVAMIVQRAFSPNVAAIPDLRDGPWPTATPANKPTGPTPAGNSRAATIPKYSIGVAL